MYPILFEGSWLLIPSWHVFLVLATLATYYSMLCLNSKFGLVRDQAFLLRLFLCVYPIGYLGARALSVFLVEQQKYPTFASKLGALLVLGPMTLYGAVLIVLAVSAVFISYSKKSFRDCIDLAGPSWLLGVAVGRIGCFLNGDDYGWPLALESWDQRPWWSVSFPSLNDTQNQVARYPVQLYEVVFCLLFSAVLVYYFPRIRQLFSKGAVGVLSLILYSCGRFVNEFYRADFRGSLFSSALSPAQSISIAVLSVCLLHLVVTWKKAPLNA